MDDNIVVLIEDTTLKLQRLLSTMVNDRLQRDVIGTQAKRIINECIKKLTEAGCTKEFIEKQRQAFMSTFTNWYMQITTNLAKLAQKTKNPTFYQSYKEITGIEPKINGKSIIINVGAKSDYGDNIELGGVKNIRDYFTTGETGYSQMFVEDYQKRVNREIMKIASMNVVLVNRKGRAISARNLAEMQVRFEEQVKDMERLKEKGAKFVVATSHANASERCQPWQGKIYILDAEVGSVAIKDNHYDGEPKPIGKTPDGKDYYSLREAMTHGFLGYNCRHRLILYKPGMIMPKEYTANQVSKERSIETTARSLERQIRVAKKRALLSSDKEERKKFREKSKKLQDVYWQYCKEHDYPVAEWRTRVSLNEREGIKSGSISNVPNDRNIGNRYQTGSLMSNNLTQAQSKTIDNSNIPEENSYRVNEVVNTKKYHDKFVKLTNHKVVNESLYINAINILKENNGTDYETLVILDVRTGKIIAKSSNKEHGRIGLNNQEYEQVMNYNKEIITLHNHPNSSEPSVTDILSMYKNSKIKYSIIACHNGNVYKISNMNRKIDLEKEYQKIYNEAVLRVQNKNVARFFASSTFTKEASRKKWFTIEVIENGKNSRR